MDMKIASFFYKGQSFIYTTQLYFSLFLYPKSKGGTKLERKSSKTKSNDKVEFVRASSDLSLLCLHRKLGTILTSRLGNDMVFMPTKLGIKENDINE